MRTPFNSRTAVLLGTLAACACGIAQSPAPAEEKGVASAPSGAAVNLGLPVQGIVDGFAPVESIDPARHPLVHSEKVPYGEPVPVRLPPTGVASSYLRDSQGNQLRSTRVGPAVSLPQNDVPIGGMPAQTVVSQKTAPMPEVPSSVSTESAALAANIPPAPPVESAAIPAAPLVVESTATGFWNNGSGGVVSDAGSVQNLQNLLNAEQGTNQNSSSQVYGPGQGSVHAATQLPSQFAEPEQLQLDPMRTDGSPWVMPLVEVNTLGVEASIGSNSLGASMQANDGMDSAHLLAPYQSADGSIADLNQSFVPPSDLEQAAIARWWMEAVSQAALAPEATPVDLQFLIDSALQHSSRIRIIAVEPALRRSEVVEECAQFNWRRYLESRIDDRNEPIGNALTTGNNDSRFRNHMITTEGGIKKKTVEGGELEIAQKLQYERSNSRFFLPNPQGLTRLELQFTQPLLNGAGRAYNRSRIVLANIEVGMADDQWRLDLQEHLIGVTEAYWALYAARAEYFQRVRLQRQAEEIHKILAGREAVDTAQRQLLRIKSAMASRRSEIIRTESEIRNMESRIRLLVNDPNLALSATKELTPVEPPMEFGLPLPLDQALHTALQFRPDVSKAIREVQASSVKTGVAKNELLPQLDLVASSYVMGLAGQGNPATAFGNQFSDGRPSYSVGFNYEMPIGNQAAQARAERARLEFVRSIAAFEWTVQEALTNVELALREVNTAYHELQARRVAVDVAERESAYLQDRWLNLAGHDETAANMLEYLLDAQERLADEDKAYVKAQTAYAMAVIRLKDEMGTLFVQMQ